MFGTILRSLWTRIRILSATVFEYIFDTICALSFNVCSVHLGAKVAPKITPRGTPKPKGGPSILNNPPSVFTCFGRVAVAGVSRERTLKRETFYYEIQVPKCLQKGIRTATKNSAEIASESYATFWKPKRKKDTGTHPHPKPEGLTQPL